MYIIRLSSQAKKDIVELQKRAPNTLKKLAKFFDELKEHPTTGTGQVEILKYRQHDNLPIYSRRLSREHRLVYVVYNEVVEVLVLSAFGHYIK